MEDMPQTRKGMLKLTSPPVKVKIHLRYKPGATEKDDPIPVEDNDPEAWLHPLTPQEMSDCEAVQVEGYRHFREKGGNENDSSWKGLQLYNYQQLYFCVRVSEKKGADRLFTDEREVMQLHRFEIVRLINLYSEAFVPTREEIKNSLRERLGQGSGTLSTSPATSGIQN